MDQDEDLQQLKAHAFKLISIRPRSISEMKAILMRYMHTSSSFRQVTAGAGRQTSQPRLTVARPESRAREVASFRSWTSQDDEKDISVEHLIKTVIDDLVERKYLDDAAFVRWWIEQRDSFRPKGRQAIRAELYTKGIDRALVDQVISSLSSNREGEYDQALALAQKRAARLAHDLPEKQKIKLSRFLQSRGFDWQTIYAVIDSVFQKE